MSGLLDRESGDELGGVEMLLYWMASVFLGWRETP